MATMIGLGDANRFMQVQNDDVAYDEPKKLHKFRKHLHMAEDVAFLPDDKIIVCDKENERVRIYNENGKFSNNLAKGIRPIGIATAPSGMVAVIDSKKKKEKYIKVYSSDNGDLFSSWGEDMPWKPKGITFSSKGQLIITNAIHKSHSVGVYSQDGRELSSFGMFGSMAKHFNNPCYVTVDMFDRIIVSDRDNHAVKIFDERGMFLGKIGGYGHGAGQLSSPRGVCTDARGNIMVCDTGNRRVCVFSLHGRYIQDLLTSDHGIGYPFGIAHSRDSNRLAVTQHFSSREGGRIRKVRIYELDNLEPLNIIKRMT